MSDPWLYTGDAPLTLPERKPAKGRALLFGNPDIVWAPEGGKEPNAWARFWMGVFFNTKWTKL
ncbi:MAG: hypothetical protein AAB426_13090 [Myxococcota bacterium]